MEPRQGRSLWVDVSSLVRWGGNVTGITRSLSQVLTHWLADPRLPIRLCRYDHVYRAFQTADPAQLPLLRPAKDADDARRPVTWALRAPPGLPPSLREACWHLGQSVLYFGRLARSVVRRSVLTGRRTAARLRKPPRPAHFAAGDVLFLGGANWEDGAPGELLQELRRAFGVRVANLIYDITPLRYPYLTHPQLTRVLGAWLPAAMAGADVAVTISEHSRRDLEEHGRRLGLEMPPVETIRLGDEPGDDDRESPPPELEKQPGPFVLYVSTVGLHKNHQLLFHVWRRLIDRHGGGVPTLVLAGGRGFRAEQLLCELRGDAALSRHVKYLARASDRQLRWLYRRCLFTVYPSHYEGWGLPVAEGMALGKFCVCSSAASLPEVGGDLACYHDPLDGPGCLALVERAILEPGWLAAREERVRREYRPTTWRDTARQTFDLLDEYFGLTPDARREAA